MAHTKEATGEVTRTAGEQAREVTREAGAQARQVLDQTRRRMSAEAKNQTERASGRMRDWSDELASMAESTKPDSPVREAVHQIADSGRRMADYLDRRGVEGAVSEVQEFARRKPGTFLLGAAVAGFLIGRAAKATVQAEPPNRKPEASSDAFSQTPSAGPVPGPADVEETAARPVAPPSAPGRDPR
jgi:hypothetical protein